MSEVEVEYQRVRPDVLQTALLYKMYKEVKELRRLVEQQIPEGIYESFILEVTEKTEMFNVYRLGWMYVDIFNRGPNKVYFSVNVDDRENPDDLNVNEGVRIEYPLIKTVGKIRKRLLPRKRLLRKRLLLP